MDEVVKKERDKPRHVVVYWLRSDSHDSDKPTVAYEPVGYGPGFGLGCQIGNRTHNRTTRGAKTAVLPAPVLS
jgi:hypothetical protein